MLYMHGIAAADGNHRSAVQPGGVVASVARFYAIGKPHALIKNRKVIHMVVPAKNILGFLFLRCGEKTVVSGLSGR